MLKLFKLCFCPEYIDVVLGQVETTLKCWVRVKGGMNLRNGMLHGLGNDIIVRN